MSRLFPEQERCSVAVCTHERPDDLRRCLTALLPAHAAGHEVLVIDNAPHTGRTARVAAEFPFRYVCAPRRGLNNARNEALRVARHAIVAFTDDDAVPAAGWAEALARPFADPAVGCVTGAMLAYELETEAQRQFDRYSAGRRRGQARRYTARTLPPAAGGLVGIGACMALRRHLALELGGFDPRLDAGTPTCSGGDIDMFARILDAGAAIVYTPEAVVFHRHRRSPDQLRRCLFGYGVGVYSFLTKRLVEQHDPRAALVAVRWLAGPFVKAAWARLCGRPALPLALLLAEAAGACLGPLRLWQATVELARVDLPRDEVGYAHADQSH